MEDQEENDSNDISKDQRMQSIIKFAGILLVLMFIWYGFNLAETI